jgi:hypothetical protein
LTFLSSLLHFSPDSKYWTQDLDIVMGMVGGRTLVVVS